MVVPQRAHEVLDPVHATDGDIAQPLEVVERDGAQADIDEGPFEVDVRIQALDISREVSTFTSPCPEHGRDGSLAAQDRRESVDGMVVAERGGELAGEVLPLRDYELVIGSLEE